MKRCKQFIHIATLTMAITFVFTGLLPVQAADEPLGIAPENSLFYAQVNNLDDTLGQTDQFLAGLSPIPVQMLIRMKLAEMLGNPSLAGVNTRGSFAVFASVPAGKEFSEDSITILIPIDDYEKFTDPNTSLTAPDSNGICELKSVGGFVTKVGSYAAIKPPKSYEALLSFKKSAATGRALSQIMTAGQTAEASKAPIWIYCNIPQVNETFGKQISLVFQMMTESMKQEMAQVPGSTFQPEKILTIYANMLNALLTQGKSYTLAVTPKADILKITETLEAIPGTKMAKLLTSDTVKEKNKLAGYLEDGAAINAIGSGMQEMNAELLELFAEVFTNNQDPENTAKIKKMAEDMAAVFSGNDAMTFYIDANSKPPFVGKYVIEVQDKEKFNKVLDNAIELFNTAGLADFYKQLGLETAISMKRGVDNYKGVSIDSVVFSMKPVNTDTPEMKQMAEAISMMYGEGLEYRLALVDGLCAYTIGGDLDGNLKKLIDKIRAGGQKEVCTEVQQAMTLLPGSENADFFCTFNVVRFLDLMPAMISMSNPAAAEGIAKMNILTTSNAVAAGNIGNGKIVVDFALPKQHLMELMQVFGMFMMHQPTLSQPQ